MGEARGKGASAVLLVPQVCSTGNAVGAFGFSTSLRLSKGVSHLLLRICSKA